MRDEFAQAVKNALAKRVANRCSSPRCRKTTSGPHSDPGKAVNIGVAAHITAAAPGGPRYDACLSSEARAGAENGIWLCGSCATLVDRDDGRFTKEELHAWKTEAEQFAREAVERLQGANEAGLERSEMRKRDIRQLRDVLYCIDLDEFDRFLSGVQMRIVVDGIWNYFYSFDGTVSSTLFFVDDAGLRHAIGELHNAWNTSLSFGDWFTNMPDGKTYRFMRPYEGNDPKKWSQAAADFDATVPRTEAAYNGLVEFVRAHYPEIDLTETSAEARRREREWEERANRLLE